MEDEEIRELVQNKLNSSRLATHQTSTSRIRHELTIMKVEFRNDPHNDLELFEAATIAEEAVSALSDLLLEKKAKLDKS